MAENKKDSFTFSDKIKNSKPAFNPFSKRVSSKIGSNGKPKKTIFERTKRDAPFFVAAAAALLMLPFLYKYSGSVNDDPIVPPGSEDSIFSPERFGFEPNVEDPSAQIAQLSGRDPLSMIKGWGDPEPAEPSYSYDRDGLDDTPYTPAVSRGNSYRDTAPAQTRASFQRNTTPTKIKELGGAAMNFRGGGGGMGRFGGSNLKAAAKQPSASNTPKQGPKPVSLQPLRAAGNPSRSYFGQGSAAQARASRDAMSKSNALQALKDADFTPIKDAAAHGGIGGGDFFGGGGSGKWDPSAEYKGITPWWWDLMKKRDQMQWELWFNLKKKVLESLVDMGLKFADGFLSCLLTNTDDWSMGSMFGYAAGSGDPDKCVDYTEETWPEAFKTKYGPFGKRACRGWAMETGQTDKDAFWKDGDKKTESRGFLGAKIDCLSNGLGWGKSKKSGSPNIQEAHSCERFTPGMYSYRAEFTGKALRNSWEKYFYIVARNYVPSVNESANDFWLRLCDFSDRDMVTYGGKISSGVGYGEVGYRYQDTYKNTRKDRKAWAKEVRDDKRPGKLYKDYATEGLNAEDMESACVIYVEETKHGIFDYLSFVREMTKEDGRLYKLAKVHGESLCKKDQIKEGKYQSCAKDLLDQLDLYFIESVAMKQKMAAGNKGLPKMPMLYSDFEDTYLSFKRVASDRGVETVSYPTNGETISVTDGKKTTFKTEGQKTEETKSVNNRKLRLDTRKEREDGKNIERGARCFFHKEVTLSCEENTNKATIKYNVNTAKGKVEVRALYVSLDGTVGKDGVFSAAQSSHEQIVKPNDKGELVYQLVNLKGDSAALEENVKSLNPGTIIWKAYRGGQIVSSTSCDYNNAGSVVAKEGGDPSGTGDKPQNQGTDTKLTQTGQVVATALAYRLAHIPQNPTDRKKIASEAFKIEATKAELAGETEKARQQAAQKLLSTLDTTANVLEEGATPLYHSDVMEKCFPSADDNIVVASDAAQAWVKEVVESYNDANKDNPIYYNRNYPSIANVMDAANIGGGSIPKAAVCQMGKIISTLGKDTTMDSQWRSNKYGKEYNNTFGAFATYIGKESVYYPADKSTDSSYEGGLNPRFYGYSPKLTSYEYHYGMYVNNGKPSNVFLSDLEARKAKSGQTDNFPLEALSRDPDFNSSLKDWENRKIYWDTYGELYESATGCDDVYGSQTMSAQKAMEYVNMVCKVGLADKPRSTNQETKTGSATIRSGSSVTASGHETQLNR